MLRVNTKCNDGLYIGDTYTLYEFEKYNYDAYCHNLIIIPTGEKNADGEDLYKLDTLYDGLISIITSIIGVEESANTEETAEGEGGA